MKIKTEESEDDCLPLEDTDKLLEKGMGEKKKDHISYELATHVVKVRRSGTLTNVSQLWDLCGTGALGKSVQDLIANNRSKLTRMSSVNSFNEVVTYYPYAQLYFSRVRQRTFKPLREMCDYL